MSFAGAHRVLIGALLLVLSFGCSRGDAPGPPNLVLIVVDTLRADHLGAYGYERPTSPSIDRLAARGVRFENASASSSWTRPSVASLFTSRLPSEHGAVSIVAPLDPAVPSFIEALREAGYRTLGVSGNFPHLNDTSGLTRGFEIFASLAVAVGAAPGNTSRDDTLMRMPLREDGRQLSLRAPTADEVNERVALELSALETPGERPLFLYVHYMDPHSGYLAPARFREPFDRGAKNAPSATSDHLVDLAAGRTQLVEGEREHLVDQYDAEIRYVDDAIGRLIEKLDALGYADDAVFVLLSDHGEEFGEHGGFFHGITLHRELLRVPLVVVDRRGKLAAGVRQEPVQLLDVPVTLLALAGLDPLPGMRGRSLFASSGEPLPARDRIAELHPDPIREEHAGPLRHAVALTRWPWKVIVSHSGEAVAYRLDQDPGEDEPATSTAPVELIAEARRQAARMEGSEGSTHPNTLSPEERAALRALGYAK